MKKIMVLTLGLVAAAALLVWALPATAQRTATTVKVTAGKPSEFHFTVSAKSVKHGTVSFAVTNSGALPHDFKINGKKTKLLTPGQSQTLSVTFAKAGKYPFMCTVTGHAAAGMKGTLTVT
jgi:uncharacterized cupredoxin-like copper-binding protein